MFNFSTRELIILAVQVIASVFKKLMRLDRKKAYMPEEKSEVDVPIPPLETSPLDVDNITADE